MPRVLFRKQKQFKVPTSYVAFCVTGGQRHKIRSNPHKYSIQTPLVRRPIFAFFRKRNKNTIFLRHDRFSGQMAGCTRTSALTANTIHSSRRKTSVTFNRKSQAAGKPANAPPAAKSLFSRTSTWSIPSLPQLQQLRTQDGSHAAISGLPTFALNSPKGRPLMAISRTPATRESG